MKGKSTLIYRILVAALGLTLSGIGVGIFLFSNLGVDAASVFETGVAKQLGVDFGTAAAIINVVILLVVLFIDRSYINISSLLAIFLIGYVAGFVEQLLALAFPSEPSLILRILFILVGNTIIALGVAVYTTPKLGVGAIDLVSQIISDKTGWTYRWVRVAGDLAFVLIGWLLGGEVGVGTVVCALLLGPTVQFLRPFVYKFTDKIPGCETKKEA